MEDTTRPPTSPLTIDDFVRELSRLRAEAGSPSYAEIAQRIAVRREQAGLPPERARIARSTVYDVFRPGRRRLDAVLIREILATLELDESEIHRWSERGRKAVPSTPGVPPEPSAPDEPAPAGVLAELATTPRSPRRLLLALLACLLVNLSGRAFVDLLDLPLHLDMTGTALAAITLGPWWGALVGVLTNSAGALVSGPSSLPFALVNVTGALVWGYGVRRFGMGRSVPRFLTLSVLCGAACSVVATPILVLAYTDGIRPGLHAVTDTMLGLTHALVLSVFVSNLLLSVVDKTISGFAALAVAEARSHHSTPLSIGAHDHGAGASPRASVGPDLPGEDRAGAGG